MPTLGNLLCLTPRESYLVDEPTDDRSLIKRLEHKLGMFVRSPGIGFPYLVGFMRKNGVLGSETNVAVQHDRIEGQTPFEEILRTKIDLNRGDHDVLFITAYTNSAREAYRRARAARATWSAAGRPLTIVFGGAHASAVPEEGPTRGHVDATVVGEGEWAASALLTDLKEGRPIQPVYRANFDRIRDRGTLALDMSIWDGLSCRPQQLVASTSFARGCKLDCHFCAVFLTNGPTVRNRDVGDVVDEISRQGPRVTRDNLDTLGPGFYNRILKALVRTPVLGRVWGERMIANMGPGFTDRYFFWDDNLYNAAGAFKALCEAIKPLGRPWSAELTIDIAEKPELLKLAYESGCRDLFLGIESVSQGALDGLDKWSNQARSMEEQVKRVHDAGIRVMGAFVFGLEGDDRTCFDRTLEFIRKTGVDYVVANLIQPYPGTGTFRDALAGNDLLPAATTISEGDPGMDYNWPLFDGAHVLVRPKKMTEEELQEGYYYFLREAYSITGILRRNSRSAWNLPKTLSHFSRNYLLGRHGMSKTSYALRRKESAFTADAPVPVGSLESQPLS